MTTPWLRANSACVVWLAGEIDQGRGIVGPDLGASSPWPGIPDCVASAAGIPAARARTRGSRPRRTARAADLALGRDARIRREIAGFHHLRESCVGKEERSEAC